MGHARMPQGARGHVSCQQADPLTHGHLQGLAPGQYLLTHQPGADAVSCFTAQIGDTQDQPVCIMHKELLSGATKDHSVCIMDKKLFM
jgi:uncharacterized NAD-dependent epimerase/dehydratase family protein